jgi:hypothetical protein
MIANTPILSTPPMLLPRFPHPASDPATPFFRKRGRRTRRSASHRGEIDMQYKDQPYGGEQLWISGRIGFISVSGWIDRAA